MKAFNQVPVIPPRPISSYKNNKKSSKKKSSGITNNNNNNKELSLLHPTQSKLKRSSTNTATATATTNNSKNDNNNGTRTNAISHYFQQSNNSNNADSSRSGDNTIIDIDIDENDDGNDNNNNNNNNAVKTDTAVTTRTNNNDDSNAIATTTTTTNDSNTTTTNKRKSNNSNNNNTTTSSMKTLQQQQQEQQEHELLLQNPPNNKRKKINHTTATTTTTTSNKKNNNDNDDDEDASFIDPQSGQWKHSSTTTTASTTNTYRDSGTNQIVNNNNNNSSSGNRRRRRRTSTSNNDITNASNKNDVDNIHHDDNDIDDEEVIVVESKMSSVPTVARTATAAATTTTAIDVSPKIPRKKTLVQKKAPIKHIPMDSLQQLTHCSTSTSCSSSSSSSNNSNSKSTTHNSYHHHHHHHHDTTDTSPTRDNNGALLLLSPRKSTKSDAIQLQQQQQQPALFVHPTLNGRFVPPPPPPPPPPSSSSLSPINTTNMSTTPTTTTTSSDTTFVSSSRLLAKTNKVEQALFVQNALTSSGRFVPPPPPRSSSSSINTIKYSNSNNNKNHFLIEAKQKQQLKHLKQNQSQKQQHQQEDITNRNDNNIHVSIRNNPHCGSHTTSSSSSDHHNNNSHHVPPQPPQQQQVMVKEEDVEEIAGNSDEVDSNNNNNTNIQQQHFHNRSQRSRRNHSSANEILFNINDKYDDDDDDNNHNDEIKDIIQQPQTPLPPVTTPMQDNNDHNHSLAATTASPLSSFLPPQIQRQCLQDDDDGLNYSHNQNNNEGVDFSQNSNINKKNDENDPTTLSMATTISTARSSNLSPSSTSQMSSILKNDNSCSSNSGSNKKHNHNNSVKKTSKILEVENYFYDMQHPHHSQQSPFRKYLPANYNNDNHQQNPGRNNKIIDVEACQVPSTYPLLSHQKLLHYHDQQQQDSHHDDDDYQHTDDGKQALSIVGESFVHTPPISSTSPLLTTPLQEIQQMSSKKATGSESKEALFHENNDHIHDIRFSKKKPSLSLSKQNRPPQIHGSSPTIALSSKKESTSSAVVDLYSVDNEKRNDFKQQARDGSLASPPLRSNEIDDEPMVQIATTNRELALSSPEPRLKIPDQDLNDLNDTPTPTKTSSIYFDNINSPANNDPNTLNQQKNNTNGRKRLQKWHMEKSSNKLSKIENEIGHHKKDYVLEMIDKAASNDTTDVDDVGINLIESKSSNLTSNSKKPHPETVFLDDDDDDNNKTIDIHPAKTDDEHNAEKSADNTPDYMSVIKSIENDHSSITNLNTSAMQVSKREAASNRMLWKNTSDRNMNNAIQRSTINAARNVAKNAVTNLFQPILYSATSLLSCKVSSPTNINISKNSNDNALNENDEPASRHRNVKAPKLKKMFGRLSTIIKPGEAIQKHDHFVSTNDTLSSQKNSGGDLFDLNKTQTRIFKQQQLDSAAFDKQKRAVAHYEKESRGKNVRIVDYTKQYLLRETKPRKCKQSRGGQSVIEICESSDDESLLSSPALISKIVQRPLDFAVFRIAIGTRVYFNDCWLTYAFETSLVDDVPTMSLVYKSDLRRNKSRKGRQNTTDATGERCNRINLAQDLLEFKYYRADDGQASRNVVVNENSHSDVSADRALLNNMLVMRVTKTEENGLIKFSNSYRPESDDASRRWIVIELCTNNDLCETLSTLKLCPNLSMFVTAECQLTANEATINCKSILGDNAEQIQSYPSFANKMGKFLAGKAEDDVLLVYPFAMDPKIIDNASSGLGELSCVLEYENVDTSNYNTGKQNDMNKAIESEKNDTDDKGNEEAIGEESRAVLEFTVATIERLEPGVYLDDTLIDFWIQWIWRSTDKGPIHYFTTHFYTFLEKNLENVTRWTERRGIDIFTKKFIFIPINKSLHWSLCVVVNPGAIMSHRNLLADDTDEYAINLASSDDPFPCLLFFDSLMFHAKARVATNIRKWLNSEWTRLHPNNSEISPFDSKSMAMYSPKIPYQDNSWDCGVYLCRYMYALYLLRSHRFTYAEVGFVGTRNNSNLFLDLITNHDAFQFNSDDVVRIRFEFMDLIERLSKLYFSWKVEDDKKRLEARRLKKLEESATSTTKIV